MKKSVLLGIAAVALFALPAFAMKEKYDGWQYSYVAQMVKDFPVKMVIPWYIHIVNEKDWVLELSQIECGDDFPCFKGCKQLKIRTNFDATLECEVRDTKMGGDWKCWYENPGPEIDKGNVDRLTDVCVKVKKADLLDDDLQSKAGQKIQVATLRILVKPRTGT